MNMNAVNLAGVCAYAAISSALGSANVDVAAVYADETRTYEMVATTDVNLRERPEDGIVIAVVRAGDVVMASREEDGWTLATYEDATGWICSAYLRPSEGAADEADLPDPNAFRLPPDEDGFETAPSNGALPDDVFERVEGKPFGTAGRFVVPRLGIDVGLNRANMYVDGAAAQAVADAEDSAALTPSIHGTADVIADHKHQGFDALYDAKPGDVAYVVEEDGSWREMVCRAVTRNGTNDGLDLLDENGRSCDLDGFDAFVYTCNPEGWWTVTVTWWDYV